MSRPFVDFFRDTAGGWLLQWASGGRLCRYPDERAGWTAPSTWRSHAKDKHLAGLAPASSPQAALEEHLARLAANDKSVNGHGRTDGQAESPDKEAGEDFIEVDWYGPNDPANPQNWPVWHKILTMAHLCLLTIVVYMGSAIIISGIPSLESQFGLSEVVAILTIALYVLFYGTGTLLFSPMSEIPAIGRLWLYIVPLLLFFALGFASLFTPTFGGLLVARILTGLMAAPPLATAAGTITDLFGPAYVPFGILVWVLSTLFGPGLGPLLTAFAVQDEGTWRWCFIVLQIATAVTLPLIFLFFPETSPTNILYRRAQRIRKLTGDIRYRSRGEILQSHLTPQAIFNDAIIKPAEITLKDPSVAYIHIYIALTYSFYYLFFTSFPIIYFEEYGFPLGTGSIPYVAILIGGLLSVMVYGSIYKFVALPNILAGKMGEPEDILAPAIPASAFMGISLFIVGWTANRTNFIVPTIFFGGYVFGNVMLVQPLFGYLQMSYPYYAASLFAANAFIRSATTFGLLLAGQPMFRQMGIGGGCSFLGGLCLLMTIPLILLKAKGKQLRARSTFTVRQ